MYFISYLPYYTFYSMLGNDNCSCTRLRIFKNHQIRIRFVKKKQNENKREITNKQLCVLLFFSHVTQNYRLLLPFLVCLRV